MARGLIMNLKQAVSSVFSKYATFSGRAQRSEYWWWALFTVLVSWVTGFMDGILFHEYALFHYEQQQVFTPISSLAGLAMFIPSIAVSARRFHDLGRSAWWLLIVFTGIGALVTFFWFMVRGTEGPNRFGSDPLDTRPV